jgi:hypothetical protein
VKVKLKRASPCCLPQTDVELTLRTKGVSAIQRIGSKLFVKLLGPIYTAVVLFHRFYARRSMKSHDPMEVVFACLFLAGKAEESLVSIRAIVNEYAKEVDKTVGPLDEMSEVRGRTLQGCGVWMGLCLDVCE